MHGEARTGAHHYRDVVPKGRSLAAERGVWDPRSVPITVLHCDDSPAFTELVRLWLADHEDLDHVGAVHDRAGAVTAAAELAPDVVILDTMGAPDDTGLLEAVRAAAPAARLIVYSGFAGSVLSPALTAGADAVVPKGADDTALVAAIRSQTSSR